MRVVTLDFETFWRSKDYTLSKMGPIQYIRDPQFSAQLLGYCVNSEPVEVAEHDAIPDVLRSLRLDEPGTVTVAHNGDGFDFLILSEIYGVVPALTLDTIPLMRWCGLSSVIPESHAALTAALGSGVKYQGTVISDGKHWPDDFTEVERTAFKLYCAQDVEQCRANLMKMLAWGVPSDVVTFCSITSHMATAPVLRADGEALSAYRQTLKQQQADAREALAHLFKFRDEEHMLSCIRSADKFCTMLRQLGVEPPMKVYSAKSETKRQQMEAQGLDTSNEDSWMVYAPALSKQDVEFLEMQEHPDPRVALLCRTRLENNSSIQESRVATFYKMAMYFKPIPVMLKTFGAHTSRYAAGNTEGKSDALNWQNLSKRNPAMLPLRQAIFVTGNNVLVSCDSSQIEARMLAYIAQQTDVLQLFAQHEDVYADFGQTISGISAKEIHDGAKSGDAKLKKLRNISKTIILGCGYGTSPNKAAHTMWVNGTHLAETFEEHKQKAAEYVGAYRSKNDAIVRLWRTCSKVISYMAAGQSGTFGGPDGKLLTYGTHTLANGASVACITMPSGFSLNYPELRLDEDGKSYVFKKKLGRSMVDTRLYGAALVENITQCLAFQLLMWQACRMNERGLWPCVNIHDSFSVVAEKKDAEAVGAVMLECMKMLPPWLPGCPIDAEVEYGKDFTHA